METTERIGSVAAMNGTNLLLHKTLEDSQRSAQSLAPTLRVLLDEIGWQPSDVDLVAVTVGPGSFTGLRIGLTTAKTFAYAVQADILGIGTLEVIANGAPSRLAASDIGSMDVVIDAQRGEVVAQSFSRDADGWMRPTSVEALIDADAWLARLTAGQIVSGPILRRLSERLPEGVVALESASWTPRAEVVAHLASRDYAAGRRDDIWQLVPHYSRCSAAEEKWQARRRSGDCNAP